MSLVRNANCFKCNGSQQLSSFPILNELTLERQNRSSCAPHHNSNDNCCHTFMRDDYVAYSLTVAQLVEAEALLQGLFVQLTIYIQRIDVHSRAPLSEAKFLLLEDDIINLGPLLTQTSVAIASEFDALTALTDILLLMQTDINNCIFCCNDSCDKNRNHDDKNSKRCHDKECDDEKGKDSKRCHCRKCDDDRKKNSDHDRKRDSRHHDKKRECCEKLMQNLTQLSNNNIPINGNGQLDGINNQLITIPIECQPGIQACSQEEFTRNITVISDGLSAFRNLIASDIGFLDTMAELILKLNLQVLLRDATQTNTIVRGPNGILELFAIITNTNTIIIREFDAFYLQLLGFGNSLIACQFLETCPCDTEIPNECHKCDKKKSCDKNC